MTVGTGGASGAGVRGGSPGTGAQPWVPAAPDTAACTGCGRPVRAGARFCTACGTPVRDVVVIAGAQQPVAPATTPAPGTRRAAAGRPRSGPVDLGPAFAGVQPALTGRRLGAYAVDALVVATVTVLVQVVGGSPLYTALAGAELIVGVVAWEARTGRTFGNLLLGLRSAREETPYALGLARAVPRALVLGAGHLLAGIGQWFVVASTAADRSGRRQGWHDRAGRAVVVDVRGPRADATPGPTGGAPAEPVAAVARAAGPATSAIPAGAVAPTLAPPGAVGSAVTSAGATSAAPPPPAASTAGAAPSPAVPTAGAARAAVPPVAGVPTPAPARDDRRAPAAARPATAYLVTLDTGQAMTVSGPGLVGRAPQVRPGERCDHVIAVDDPERSLSRTHARFGVEPSGFWVADAGSGNGTVLVLPSGQSVRVGPDQRVAVPSGSTIRIGDRSFTVQALPPR